MTGALPEEAHIKGLPPSEGEDDGSPRDRLTRASGRRAEFRTAVRRLSLVIRRIRDKPAWAAAARAYRVGPIADSPEGPSVGVELFAGLALARYSSSSAAATKASLVGPD